ncbi:hypothetical protein BJ742DRAFT_804168 [Cladochytrium replicatum]|nr:hypothetical protein BJ742DRAFT_804168 [Cladochytrium replicatum]
MADGEPEVDIENDGIDDILAEDCRVRASVDDNAILHDGLDLFPEPEWFEHGKEELVQSVSGIGDMDEKSKALIEAMIAEEAFYFGQSSLDALEERKASSSRKAEGSKKESKQPKRKISGPSGIDSSDEKSNKHPKTQYASTDPGGETKPISATHAIRWTEEEDNKLIEGVKTLGFGSWKKIASHIGTRNAVQVKNRARHLQTTRQVFTDLIQPLKAPMPPAPSERENDEASADNESETFVGGIKEKRELSGLGEVVKLIKDRENGGTDDDEDVEIDITDAENDFKNALPAPSAVMDVDSSSIKNAQQSDSIHGEDELEENVNNGDFPIGEDLTPQGEDRYSVDGGKIEVDARNSVAGEKGVEADVVVREIIYEDGTGSLKSSSPDDSTHGKIRDSQHQTEDSSQTAANHSPPEDPMDASEAPYSNLKDQVPTNLEEVTLSAPTTSIPRTMTSVQISFALIKPDAIHQFEIDENREFFPAHFEPVEGGLVDIQMGRKKKGPERYVLIRNHIIDQWRHVLRTNPHAYLAKTKARAGLKGVGDVNAIARVYEFLERVGAINNGNAGGTETFSATRAPAKRKAEVPAETVAPKPVADWSADLFQYDGKKRQRRVRNEDGQWVDESWLEGRVIDHDALARTEEEMDEMDDERNSLSRRLMAKNAKYFDDDVLMKFDPKLLQKKYQTSGANNDVVDPFTLIPARRSDDIVSDTFSVNVQSSSMVVMDFHAHLADTEIIGLLGGHFDQLMNSIYIKTAYPCNSLSTGFQCEMDPESEMKARQAFESEGCQVVGWYHSHPTFQPEPSVRDLENQAAYQSLFQRNDGSEPFVCVIVSPYDTRHPFNESRFSFLCVKEWNSSHTFRVPYSCRAIIQPSSSPSVELFNQLSDLVKDYRSHKHKVDLSAEYRRDQPGTKLDKLLTSLDANLMKSTIHVDEHGENVVDVTLKVKVFLKRVRELLVKGFQL